MSLSGGQDIQIIQAQLVAWGFSDPPAIITNSLSFSVDSWMYTLKCHLVVGWGGA